MTQMQSMLVDMVKWYHELCEKEGLQYFAFGGTALGAVRHKGFIPWDDDVDVAMPRDEYEKLLKLAEKINGNSRYYIEVPGANEDYIYPYCKIYDTQTTLIEDTRYITKRGIYIDVFPIDGVGNTLEEGIETFATVDKKVNWHFCGVCKLRKGRKLYKNIAIMCVRLIPKFLNNPLKNIKKIDQLSKRKKYSDCEYVANFVGNWHEKDIMKKSWVDETMDVPFESATIRIPKDYDSYLTRTYGDYMQPPPEDKRVSLHANIYMNLEEPYMKIKK